MDAQMAALKIKEANPKISHEISEEINTLYSLGYVYNPYKKVFINLFIENKFKEEIVSNYKSENITQIHNQILNDYLRSNYKVKSLSQIEAKIYGNNKSSWLGTVLNIYSGIIGIIFLLLAIVLFFLSYKVVAMGFGISSFLLVSFYTFYNESYGKNEGTWALSQFYRRTTLLFLILFLLIHPLAYYLIYQVVNNWWLPIIIILILKYITEFIATEGLSTQYLQQRAIIAIRDYSESIQR